MPIHCPACGREASASARYCPECGAALPSSSDSETIAGPSVPSATLKLRADTPSSGRFLPGAVVAGRYRMVGLIGRGGMGEVYRADDLKLSQPVALKFLPAEVERHAERLEHFMNEVRMSLRVTHPNVCRVFDIGQIQAIPAKAGGRSEDVRHFLSMEFVDGEDLASLLRRIGRLPEDKAVEIARQLCAGLSAAHDEGVLHRDLKPANIMIDGRGRAKITDFGLAGATEGISGRDAKAGTPQYMAPEQVSGGALSERTDIYALGLVLYELFTGKRAFDIKTIDDLPRLSEITPTSPTSHVSGLNPLVERAILRCLDPDPAKRPPSAAALAAALPGGDPLAMAIAAGDTPSPEMVAAAGSDSGLTPATAWSLLLVALAGMIALGLMAGRLSMNAVAAPDKPPVVLVEQSRELLRSLGFPAAIQDSAWGFGHNPTYFNRPLEERAYDGAAAQALHARPFWYREAPVLLERASFVAPYLLQTVWPFDPQPRYSGEVIVQLDRKGQLQQLSAIPQQLSSEPPGRADWSKLFEAAGLDLAGWRPDSPKWTPLHFGDEQVAFAPIKEHPSRAIRIEAASFRGRPVSFQVIYPWTVSTRDAGTWRTTQQRTADLVAILFLSIMMLAGLLVARRNLRLDRADRRGGMRVAIVVFCLAAAMQLLQEHHVPSIWELYLIMTGAGLALFMAALVGAFYLALEPYVRRIWPAVIVSWSRLLSGDVKNPLVARDVLIGCAAAGIVHGVALAAEFATGAATGLLPLILVTPHPLMGLRFAGATFIIGMIWCLFQSLMYLLVLLGLRKLLHREWAAIVASTILMSVIGSLPSSAPLVVLPFYLVNHAAMFLLLARVGLVAGVAASYTAGTLVDFPLTWPPDAWHANIGFMGLGVTAALAIVAFKLATPSARGPAHARARLADSQRSIQ